MNITDATQKRALLLHYAGPDVDDIFETLPNTSEDIDYKKAVECLNTYFVPKVNMVYEEYQFRQAKQRSSENLASYHTRLRQLAKHCGFADVDKEIRTQIVFSCTSHKHRLRALREDLSLTVLLEAGRVAEITDRQARDIRPTSTDKSVNALPSRSKPYPVHPDQHAPPHTPNNQRTHTHCLILSVEIAADRFLMLFPALPMGERVILVAKMDILPKFIAPNPSSALVLSNK
jgi:hypothetical protein